MAKEYEKPVIVVSRVEAPLKSIIVDNFERLERWDFSGTGTDWEAYKEAKYVLDGNYSLAMKSKATTPAANDYVQGIRPGPVPRERYARLVFHWMPGNTNNAVITMRMKISRWKNAGNDREYGVSISQKNNTIKILKSDGTWVTLDSSALILGTYAWGRIELVVKRKTGQYLYLRYCDKTYTVTAYKGEEVTTEVAGGSMLKLYVAAEDNARIYQVFDNISLIGTDNV